MTVARFEGTGPVARYWLGKCEGFTVKGGAHGVVEELIHDDDPYTTTRLVVRTRSRRRRVLPAAAVASVVPAERTLVVARPERHPRRPRPRPSLAPVAARAARLGPPVKAATASFAAAASARAAEWGPPARQASARLLRAGAGNVRAGGLVVAQSLRILLREAVATGAMLARSGAVKRRRRADP